MRAPGSTSGHLTGTLLRKVGALRMRAAVVLLALAAVGCMPAEPPPPPFRTAPTGPGLETDLPGYLVTLEAGGEALLRGRSSRLGFRLQDASAVPIERVRLRSEGWTIQGRAGEVVCNSFYVEEHGTSQLTLVCEDGDNWLLRQSGDAIRIDRGDQRVAVISRSGDEVGGVAFEGSGDAELQCEAEARACVLSRAGEELARMVGTRWAPVSDAIALVAMYPELRHRDASARSEPAAEESEGEAGASGGEAAESGVSSETSGSSSELYARALSLAWLYERVIVRGNPFEDDEGEASTGHTH